jgi:two-component system, OmpR family, phosphate regulon sensor histidine kinase PhoR
MVVLIPALANPMTTSIVSRMPAPEPQRALANLSAIVLPATGAALGGGVMVTAGGVLAAPVPVLLAAVAGALAVGLATRLLPQPKPSVGPVAAPVAPVAPVMPVPGRLERTPGVQGFPAFVLAALDAAPMPVLIIDSSWRLRAANAAGLQRFSLAKIGIRADSQLRRPDLVDSITRVIAGGPAHVFSLETTVPIEQHETATVAPFEADGLRYVLLTLIDGTEARRSERMRADFLANASHELRTPLASILGCIETLQGPARDDPASHARFLGIMHEQGLRMGRLIADLLSLSRIEINEHVRPTSQFDLRAGLLEAVEAIGKSPRAAGIRFVTDVPEDPVMVRGDWDQIQQLITNLADNAIKYGPAGGEVRIVLEPGQERAGAVVAAGRRWDDAARLPLTSPEQEAGRTYVVLRVEDDGPGIDPQLLPRLAERFYRVDSTAHLVPGTGLGLAIVKHILTRHRGGLIVETRPGRGAAFGAYLPQP